MDTMLNPDPVQIVIPNKDVLVNALRQAMRETAFSNRLLLAPRRLQEIGQHEAEAFLGYLQTLDLGSVQERGKRLALEGLGHRSVLALTTALRHTFLRLAEMGKETWSVFLTTVDSYISALMEGYMAGIEEDLRREAERTQRAYARSIENQSLQS